MSRDFVHLHCHSDGSLLDGLAKADEYAKRAAKLGQRAIALTDHGFIPGPEFYGACKKAEIGAIMGCEFYYVKSFAESREAKTQERFHITILGAGADGYRSLAAASRTSHENYYYKPLLDRAGVERLPDTDRDRLVVLSGCMGSRLSQLLLAGDEAGAIEELTWWREMFRHYYIELMDHGIATDERLNGMLIELADRYDIPLVITNDPHYAVPEDAKHHDALLAIQVGKDIDDPERFRFDGTGYHLKSRKAMHAQFSKYGEEIWYEGANNTLVIAEQCVAKIDAWDERTWQIPKFPDVEDSYAELKRLASAGLTARGLRHDSESVARTKLELAVIKQAGISDFMLITRDIIDWARSEGIPVGPGRGSVAGCYVGYLVGIHKMDSLKYNLIFERFLNPARPKMPDIDTDFGQRRRGEIFTRCSVKYGAENVMNVAAYQQMRAKRAFQSLARAYGVGFEERNRLSKMIVEREPDDEGSEDSGVILPVEMTDRFPELAEQLARLVGTRTSVSTHPAGLIISSPEAKLRDQVPEMWLPSSKKWVSQFDLKAIEKLGLMKQDFLGLRTLDTVYDECLGMLKARGIEFDPDEWVPDEEPDDDQVYAMIAAGRTAGVFQLEGPTCQRGSRDVQPDCFEDLVSITSLYRTGAISAGFPKIFLENRKHGKKHIPYIHPSLKHILRDTWGVVLYQEQVMQMGSDCAGFDMVLVDDIKEAIKHKSSDEMGEIKPKFIKGCMSHSRMNRSTAEAVWKMIEGYSGYGYNRAHAVAYTFLTYITARLKYLYPQEYFTALLRTVPNNKDNTDKRSMYLREATEAGLKVLPPDINISDESAVCDYELNGIRFGLADLTGIGEKVAAKIVSARASGSYSSLQEVASAVNNIGYMRILSESQSLSALGVPGSIEAAERLLNWTFRDTVLKYRQRYADKIMLPEDSMGDEEVCIVGEIYSIDRAETKTGKPYMTWKIRHSITQQFDIRLWAETEAHWGLGVGSVVLVTGKFESKWQNLSIGNPRQVKVVKRK